MLRIWLACFAGLVIYMEDEKYMSNFDTSTMNGKYIFGDIVVEGTIILK